MSTRPENGGGFPPCWYAGLALIVVSGWMPDFMALLFRIVGLTILLVVFISSILMMRHRDGP
jgi:hypothetical protein